MIGRVLGSYRITAQIGTGGMGVVYAAEHVAIGRKAAVKVLLPKYSGNSDVINRFFNEAKAAAKIEHRGIVDVYDFGHDDDGVAYIIMEFLDGESLGDRMRRLRRLELEDLVRITRQVSVALAAAHDAGIVHRDLKPDNIFLVPDLEVIGGERVKLLDFGIAKLVDDMSDGMSKTKTGVVMGSPLYMSPEQCRGAGEADYRSDIYALGCVMYHVACGRPPFVGKGGGEILAKHIYEDPARPRNFAPEMPSALEHLILTAMSKEPDERFPDMREMVAAIDAAGGVRFRSSTEVVPYDRSLRDALSATELSGPSVSGQPPMATTLGVAASQLSELSIAPPRKKRRTALFATLGVVGTAALIALVVAAGGSDGGGAEVAAGTTDAATVRTTGPDAGAPEPVDAAPAKAVDAAPAKVVDAAPRAKSRTAPRAKRQPAKVKVRITSKPTGATIIDASGRVLGKTPETLNLPRRRGARTFTLRKSGYDDQRLRIDLRRDRQRSVALKRTARPKPSGDKKPGDKKPGDKKPGDKTPNGGWGDTADPFNTEGKKND